MPDEDAGMPRRTGLSRREFLSACAGGTALASMLRSGLVMSAPQFAGGGSDWIRGKGSRMDFGSYRTEYVVPTPKEAHFPGKPQWKPETTVVDGSWGTVDGSGLSGLDERYARALNLSRCKGAKNLCLIRDEALAKEEYHLEIATDGIGVTASSMQGFLHGMSTLQQLRNGPIFPIGKIRDYPRLPMRGFHLMFEAIHQMGAEEAVALITSAARLKLNTVLVEFGDRFPFEKHRVVRSPSALTREELSHMLEHARSVGVEPIPLLQSLGHLGYLLKHDEYAHIREEDQYRDQMCPTNEQSFRVFTELADEVLSFFPGTRFMHIGADETRRLGICPRCREQAEKNGKESLYINHVNRVCSWLSERGITPILWDDILCAHPHILGALHDSASIMYWDYWTTQSPSPLLVARYNPDGKERGIVYDRRWLDEWKGELPEVTAKTLAAFAQPVELDEGLGPELLRVYGAYLGDQLPKLARAFPYLEYYQAAGRNVIGAPAGASNTSEWLGLPDFPRYAHNIRTVAERCAEAGAQGLVTTAWYNFPPEALYFSLLATAQFAW